MVMVATSLFKKRLVLLLGSAAVLVVIENDILLPSLRLPSLLRNTRSRYLSLDLGGGRCEWAPADAPESTIDFHKTLIAGYPSGDKRMVFIQMEALTGWAAIDSWDFRTKSNHPFIKTNYPHLEGMWGWGGEADQVVLVVRNIRTSLIEYHDIAWDFEYQNVPQAASAEEKATLGAKLYASQPPIEAFYSWRDSKVMDEIDWYGWFIDYWMEGGLRRDVLTHEPTTHEHWDMLRDSAQYGRAALSYDLNVGPDTVVTPSYDNFCEVGSSLISEGCAPVAVFSGEKLADYEHGPAETEAIANVLLRDARTGRYVIPSEAWDCIWNETIVRKKGGATVYDRPNATYDRHGGRDYSDRGFSAEMLTKMLLELTRLTKKYSGVEWNDKATANRLVELLTEHSALIKTELDEVNSGLRRLVDKDFLGPKTRLFRSQKSDQSPDPQENFDQYFDSFEKKASIFQRWKRMSSEPAGLRAWAHMVPPW